MRTIARVAELRTALAEPRRAGRTVGLVPTMGALHDGHLSLMRQARAECDVVVASLFVNPTQFNDAADLTAYPRDLGADAALAADEGVDILFAPTIEEVYPSGFATTVAVAGLTESLEGAHRGIPHFDGVCTVVTKLFNMVGADLAYFGQKDAQQTVVIKRLVRDLDIPIRIRVCPTVREPDGLAMSSRNAHLAGREREQATALHRALQAIAATIDAGERNPDAALAAGRAELERVVVAPEYLELVDADTLAPVARLSGEVLAVVAARVGPTRLIDNQPIHVCATADGEPTRAAGRIDSGRP